MKHTPTDLRVSFTKLPRQRGSFMENVVLLLLLLVVWALLGPMSCRCGGGEPPPPPTPVPDASATASQPLPPPPPPQDPEWAVVGDLDAVKGHWGEGGGEETEGDWCELTSRADALAAKVRWGLPYPWRLQMKGFRDQPPWDCGFYEKLEDDWRVGYCVGGDIEGNARSAHRVVLHTLPGQPPQLRVRIGSKVEVILNR